MKSLTAAFAFLVFAAAAWAQGQGMDEIKARTMNERLQGQVLNAKDNTGAATGRVVNMTELQKKTQELNRLFESVNKDFAGLNKGVMSADLPEKLKQIEKLSKDLRRTLE